MLNLRVVPACHKTITHSTDAARCPRCGSWSPRNETTSTFYWEANLAEPTVTEVQAGCYLCPQCPEGKRWFKVVPPAYRTLRQYTIPARLIVVDLVRRYNMSIEQAALFGREELHLPKLNASTVQEWFREAGNGVDFRGWQEATVKTFSGQLAVDEVYDGPWGLLKATDPLNGLELDCRVIEGSPTEEDIREFFGDLKATGFNPALVVTDGSSLYPSAIKTVWPEAVHQRCVFHFLKQVNEDLARAFWKAYETMPKPPKRKRGRPKKRGRPRKDKEKRENRRKVRKARYLLLKREDRLDEREAAVLDEAMRLCPPLRSMRRFVVQLHELFGPTTTTHELAEERRRAILDDSDFADLAGLALPLKRLRDDDLFARLTRYLDFENADKTSNHPERENREFRRRQKSHYRLRSIVSICALLDLLLVRKTIPAEPQRLRRREPPAVAGEEVLAA